MAANSGDLVQSLIEGGLAPQAARILGNVLANANSPALSKGQDQEDATPAAMLRMINSDARRYMLKNLDFSPSFPFQKQLESTVGQYAGPPLDHPYKDSQPVSSASSLATPRIQAGDYVSVETQVDGNAAVSKVGLRLRLQEGEHLRIDPSTKFLDAVRFAARTETPQFLAAEFVDSGPETLLLVSLRNLANTTIMRADGTEQNVFVFPDSPSTPVNPGFLPAAGSARFEEGNWTPDIYAHQSNGSNPVYAIDSTATQGRYYRLGQWVHAAGRFRATARTSNGQGAYGIIGLPYPIQVTAGPFPAVLGFRAGFSQGPNQAYAQNTTDQAGGRGRDDLIVLARTNNASTVIVAGDVSATPDITVSVVYRTEAAFPA